MGLVSFGAHSLYWQVRLEQPAATPAPAVTQTPAASTAPAVTYEIVCYKNDGTPGYPNDPVIGPLTTTRWRDAPVSRPEGAFMGAQHVAVLPDGRIQALARNILAWVAAAGPGAN